MSRQHFTVIGMTDDRSVWFPPEVRAVIASGRVFSGGKRHHEIVAPLLPEGAAWIDITVPLEAVFDQYAGHAEVVVFASGDPLFFGFANTLRRELPDAEITVFPSFNSLQLLAHRILLPYADMRTVSLTGRPWEAFDEALIRGERLIGVLTDRQKTPALIARRMLEYGYDNYRITVGECLGNRDTERVRTLSLAEATAAEFAFPNCLILAQTVAKVHPFGLPEQDFALLDGRVNMITKMPIRLLTLSQLDLAGRRSFWDIGFCTGSVSIEARLRFPQLQLTAFEIREAGRELMAQNARKFGAPGIDFHIGDFLEADLSALPAPDAVFIGGHGGRLGDFLQRIDGVLLPGGRIVFNAVSEQSQALFRAAVAAVGRRITNEMHVSVDSFNPINIMTAE
ncbi:MAG: precorrin-6y C5,15-methyltransferase (decarboxylating) subunit CbiE [Bacteroidales bacterium]|nr:precorrin-6y C5,15-methyltransferase (decarboxylating) subunit CbiE [Bacteroidales bacterium]MBR6424278.1 precorrin-6y C5,15-methyltransferase (decarboxylating) subunit CbiE [Bacteroidales bacterium]